ncbi:phasin family protein [Microvirga zambiensis]|uniref:phasin family protein n=1 Tax=Microvirga zambiensis TaxID=1402137 RepID=UPI00191F7106|nr:phasin family protein [Microvirga zambiensis]
MPARHFGQTPPDRANDLFDKLLATSDGAAKTRERLLLELKDELDLLANLQEQHLFPILRKHDMQDLLEAAVSDNRETAALLEELASIPKSGGEFLGKIAALRQAFQKHIRDDRKELLPAILQVLSAEEAQAVADKVEDEMASFSDVREPELDAEGHDLQTVPDGVVDIMHTGTESAQAMTVGVHDISRECLRMSQKRLQTNLEGWTRLAQCRSPQDFANAQISLLQDNLELTLSNGARLADLAVQLTEMTTWKAALRAVKMTPHSRDFA